MLFQVFGPQPESAVYRNVSMFVRESVAPSPAIRLELGPPPLDAAYSGGVESLLGAHRCRVCG